MVLTPEWLRFLHMEDDNMGKGDKKTRRGKIYRNSHGNARPHKVVRKSDGEASSKRTSTRKTTRRRASA